MSEQRLPLFPFILKNAMQKVRMAENAWNGRDPEKVVFAYTIDSVWRNRSMNNKLVYFLL